MKKLASIYVDVVKENVPINFTMTQCDLSLWHKNRLPHAMDFLKAIPIQVLNQAIGPRQLRSVLMYRFGIPLFSDGSACSCCNRAMDVFGDHAIHCGQ